MVERGSHAELVAAGGFYARLHQKQQLELAMVAAGGEALDPEDLAP